jgi:hypothetical protein
VTYRSRENKKDNMKWKGNNMKEERRTRRST